MYEYFSFTSQSISTFIPALRSWGTESMFIYVPCMSPALPKYLARNGAKRVLCISHLTVLIFTQLEQPFSGCSPHMCPLQASTAVKDVVSQPNFRGYPTMIKSDSSPIVCLSKSLSFPLFPINSHYKNIVLV